MERVAELEAIWRHPVKGMRGERVAQAEVRWTGIAGDRRYAFSCADDRSRFPWFTARIKTALLKYQPRFEQPADPRASVVRVRSPEGVERAIDDRDLRGELERLYEGELHLLHSGRGLHDASPLSLIGAATVEALCQSAELAAEPRRFRNNFVIGGLAAFAEEAWVGRTLQLGDRDDAPRIRIDRRNERCVIITIDPDSLDKTPELLGSLAVTREACAGLYASVVRPGTARAGDALFLPSVEP